MYMFGMLVCIESAVSTANQEFRTYWAAGKGNLDLTASAWSAYYNQYYNQPGQQGQQQPQPQPQQPQPQQPMPPQQLQQPQAQQAQQQSAYPSPGESHARLAICRRPAKSSSSSW